MEKCAWKHRTWMVIKRLILVLLILFCIGINASSNMASEPVSAAAQK